MRGELVLLGAGIVFIAVGVLAVWLNAKQLSRLSLVWRVNEASLMNLPTGKYVKVTGVVEPHPDAELLPSPFTTTGSQCVSREWSIEEGYWWHLAAEGYEGVPALLSSDGHVIRVNMQNVDPPLLLASE